MVIAACRKLKKYFHLHGGVAGAGPVLVKAVDGVSLEIDKGGAFGLVGESGSGKTTLGKVLLGIMKPDSGDVSIATRRIQVIFQDPYHSLDPKMAVLDIVAEGLLLSRGAEGRRARRKAVIEALRLVGIADNALEKYPHEFSGGERQRIAIARAVISRPEFIVCDEPVSSLDATIQLQILRLLKDIQARHGITFFFISHDLRAVKFMCERVAVMKSGRIVEEGPCRDVFLRPSHPYTRDLLSAVLDIYAAK
jgi:ABC-type oligopeptide transport system ATPase subunit